MVSYEVWLSPFQTLTLTITFRPARREPELAHFMQKPKPVGIAGIIYLRTAS